MGFSSITTMTKQPTQTQMTSKDPAVRYFPVPDRWCLHSYNSLCPYAPDGSGRIIAAGADLDRDKVEILILSRDGEVLERFGEIPSSPSFWHTGLWQSWGPGGRFVYFLSGSLLEPFSTRHDLKTGEEVRITGDLEGIPPSGEPGISCSHSMLYAAGYASGKFRPELSAIPFLARDRHGISEMSFDPPKEKLILSTRQILDLHPDRERILAADEEVRSRLGKNEGLTLMTYCVRWNRQGTRFLFYWGNHNVVKSRGEPKLAYIFTSDREMKEIRLALDLSFGKRGSHWSWQPDGEALIGYADRTNGEPGADPAEVRYDGTGYRTLCHHFTGRGARHPSVSPLDRDVIVTDEITETGGSVVFFSRKTGLEIGRVDLPKFIGESEPEGRNALRVCHHPVFDYTGERVLCNSMPGRNAVLAEIDVKAVLSRGPGHIA